MARVCGPFFNAVCMVAQLVALPCAVLVLGVYGFLALTASLAVAGVVLLVCIIVALCLVATPCSQ